MRGDPKSFTQLTKHAPIHDELPSFEQIIFSKKDQTHGFVHLRMTLRITLTSIKNNNKVLNTIIIDALKHHQLLKGGEQCNHCHLVVYNDIIGFGLIP